ncbi:DUF3472 domain-containing protein [Rhodohalobacter sulfatireducens]|uniref:DUF3472 domain-containing protein n=1 Tax=Rhodohalobacter sulfatireducens TaxID=2911366 RepID=A0ABS9KDC3_9BACT|nr:DUF3472 domain-containing protein [Rhodohalobacter sulfatireducens]MCG2588851.1 DUF3472 domain-containing protein [Rhodohalobacter sulfatireducens]
MPKNPLTIVILSIVYFFTSCTGTDELDKLQFSLSIPTEGNSWVVDDQDKNRTLIGENGIKNWVDKETRIRTYFKTEIGGMIDLGLIAKSSDLSEIKITLGENISTINVENSTLDTINVGKFEIKEPGYHFVEIQGIEKSGDYFPEIQAILIGGDVSTGKVWFAKDDFYWGRRGPSVHLNYQVPKETGDVVYFYNEITVPEGNDVLGSYFMANGFGQGYFGIQVNSSTERRVLFSVWSPYETDNPDEIPDDQKIELLKKGKGVYSGEFGNEGSGGQSYYKFMWETDTTYQFLLKGEPTGDGKTDFTAWFFAPEVNEWKLIASFRRPKTDSYLTNLYSFLENFQTTTGNITRKGNYSNHWIYTTDNEWIEINKIKFTADATARKESRMDYAGGVEGDQFYLKNCGFFSKTTPIDSFFERDAGGESPFINFDDLP